MQRASAAIIASGTATLQAAYFRLPFVLVYKVAWLTYLPARAVIRVKYLGMPNVLAGRAIVPEFIQHHARPRLIAEAMINLIESESARATTHRRVRPDHYAARPGWGERDGRADDPGRDSGKMAAQ